MKRHKRSKSKVSQLPFIEEREDEEVELPTSGTLLVEAMSPAEIRITALSALFCGAAVIVLTVKFIPLHLALRIPIGLAAGYFLSLVLRGTLEFFLPPGGKENLPWSVDENSLFLGEREFPLSAIQKIRFQVYPEDIPMIHRICLEIKTTECYINFYSVRKVEEAVIEQSEKSIALFMFVLSVWSKCPIETM